MMQDTQYIKRKIIILLWPNEVEEDDEEDDKQIKDTDAILLRQGQRMISVHWKFGDTTKKLVTCTFIMILH